MRASARTFTAMPSVDAKDFDAVQDAVERAAPLSDQLLTTTPTEEQRRLLAETVAKFIGFRATKDADGYADWMRSRGCTLTLDTPGAEIPPDLQMENLKQNYNAFAGEPMPEKMSAYEIYQRMFELELDCMGTSLLVPDSFVTGTGVAVLYRRVTNDSPIAGAPFSLEPLTSIQLWDGVSSMSGEQHWTPPVTEESLLARDGVVLIADVLLATRSPHGQFAPLSLSLVLDPETDLWQIVGMSISNIDFAASPCGAGVY